MSARLSRFAVLLLLWPALLRADRFYDVGSNTTFASFPAALTQVLADNGGGPFAVTVHVRAQSGLFAALDLNSGTYPLNPQPAAGLVLEALPGASPVFSGSGSSGLRVAGLANVTLRGMTIQGSNLDNLRLESAANLVADSLVLQGGSTSAITAIGCQSLLISNSQLGPASGTGLFLSACADARISNDALLAGSAPSYGFVVENSPRAWLDQDNSASADQAFSVFSSSNVSLSANVAINRSGLCGIALDNAPCTWVLKNLVVGESYGIDASSSTGCAFMQNTVWDHGTAGLYAHSNCAPLVLRNNLWEGFLALFMDSATQAGVNSDYQGFGPLQPAFILGVLNYSDLGSWQATGNDGHSLVSDPFFVNGSGSHASDFKLSPASPMQGYGANPFSALYNSDFFLDPLAPVPTPWDPGIHVVSGIQATPSATPMLPTATVTPTVTPSPSATPTASVTPSPIGTPTNPPPPTKTPTVTLTLTATPYPIQSNRVITLPQSLPALGRLAEHRL